MTTSLGLVIRRDIISLCEVRRSVCVVCTAACLVELDLISGARIDTIYHILRCSAVVAASVSGGRHEDLLASSHGDNNVAAEYSTAPHTRDVSGQTSEIDTQRAPKAPTSLSLVGVCEQEAQHGASLQPHQQSHIT
jgi:hypothetical protein